MTPVVLNEIDLNINEHLRDHAFAVEYVAALEEAQRDSDKRYEAQLSTLRTETIEMCAKVADHHAEISRGFDVEDVVCSESIAKSIRALSKTQEVGK